jgi:hypothetical protein
LSAEEKQERDTVLTEVRTLMENFNFGSQIERDVVNVMIYGKVGDWAKLRRSYDLGIGKFNKIRQEVVEELKEYLIKNCSKKTKDVIFEVISEK